MAIYRNVQPGAAYAYDFDTLMGGENGLLSRLAVRGIPEPDRLIDCRLFKNKDFDRRILGHTGHHYKIVEQAVWHPKFQRMIKSCFDDITKFFEDYGPQQDMTVMPVCTSGAHRSVAVALVLHHMLQKLSLIHI